MATVKMLTSFRTEISYYCTFLKRFQFLVSLQNQFLVWKRIRDNPLSDRVYRALYKSILATFLQAFYRRTLDYSCPSVYFLFCEPIV